MTHYVYPYPGPCYVCGVDTGDHPILAVVGNWQGAPHFPVCGDCHDIIREAPPARFEPEETRLGYLQREFSGFARW